MYKKAIIVIISLCLVVKSVQGARQASIDTDRITLNPYGSPVGSYLLAYKNFRDIRIDSNFDGKIDKWFLKKDNVEVLLSYKEGNISSIHFKFYGRSTINEMTYIPGHGAKFKRIAMSTRSFKRMNGEFKCPLEKRNLSDNALEISNTAIRNSIDPYFSDSCVSQSAIYLQLSKNLADTIISERADKSISSCMEKNKLPEGLPLSGKEDKGLTPLLLAERFRLEVGHLEKGSDDFVGKVNCGINAKTKGVSALYDEKGAFNFLFQEQADKVSDLAVKTSIDHEILHMCGLENDEMIKQITDKCIGPLGDKQSFDGQSGATFDHSSDIPSVKAKAAQDAVLEKDDLNGAKPATLTEINSGSKANSLDIANEIATAQPIPSATQVAQTPAIDRSPEGLANALDSSYGTSAPVFAFANQVLSTPAVASTGNLATTSSPSSNSKVTDRSVPQIAPSGNSPSGGRVVEQIELSPAEIAAGMVPQASTTAAANTVAQTRDSSNQIKRVPASVPSVQRKAELASGGQGGSGVDLSAGSSSLTSPPALASLQTSEGSEPRANQKPATAQRKPASISNSSRSEAAPSTSRDEIVTFISKSNYDAAKKKLQDPSFIKNLNSSGVKILDLYGNSYGAKNAKIIFLDEGDHFALQK